MLDIFLAFAKIGLFTFIMTVVLGTGYFGLRKVLKNGISPIGLIGISALAGLIAYGF